MNLKGLSSHIGSISDGVDEGVDEGVLLGVDVTQELHVALHVSYIPKMLHVLSISICGILSQLPNTSRLPSGSYLNCNDESKQVELEQELHVNGQWVLTPSKLHTSAALISYTILEQIFAYLLPF